MAIRKTPENTICVNRSIFCEDCCSKLDLFSHTNVLAAKEAREEGWRFLPPSDDQPWKGWYCPKCNRLDSKNS